MTIFWITGLGLVLLAYWRPMVAVAVLNLLWPAYLVRTSVSGIPTTLLEVSLYAVSLGVIISLWRKRWPRPKIPADRTLWWLLLWWSGSWIIATLFSPDIRASLGALKAWWFDPLLFAGLLWVVVRTATERTLLIRSLVSSAAVVAVAGLYQLGFVRNTLQEGRLSSFFTPVANYAAMYLAPLLVFGVALALFRTLQKAWWVLLFVIGLALLATLSYGGFAAAVAGGFVAWLFLPATRLKRNIALATIILLIIGGGILATTKNFRQHFDADRSSGSVRRQIWVTSWALITKHPLLGVGPNAYEVAYRQELPKHYFPPLEWDVAQPHNLALALWLETGLAGLLAAITIVVYFFRRLSRHWQNISQRPYTIAALAAFVAILVHGIVDTPFLKNDLALLAVAIMMIPWVGRMEDGAEISRAVHQVNRK